MSIGGWHDPDTGPWPRPLDYVLFLLSGVGIPLTMFGIWYAHIDSPPEKRILLASLILWGTFQTLWGLHLRHQRRTAAYLERLQRQIEERKRPVISGVRPGDEPDTRIRSGGSG